MVTTVRLFLLKKITLKVAWIQECLSAQPKRYDSGMDFQQNDSGVGPKVRGSKKAPQWGFGSTKNHPQSLLKSTTLLKASCCHFRERKISPKVFCPKFFLHQGGHGRPRVRVMDVRTQMLVFPRFKGPARSL